jgi:hypothetical protein
MSVSTEVQRTLVKSPPELWSELSNPDALARHLSALGNIRITAVEPETKVEWAADGASGIVHLKQSGWGTRVTLSLTRDAPTPEDGPQPETVADAQPAEPEPGAEANPEPAADAQSAEPEPIVGTEPEADAAPATEPVAEAEPVVTVEAAPRQGFFARLFGRRRAKWAATVEPEPTPEPMPEPEVVALAAPEPEYPEPEPQPEPVSDLAAELASVEAQMTQETTELLTGVLDRLGAAHHRPFSRG